eukprot:136271-Rhodomonas_salina.1
MPYEKEGTLHKQEGTSHIRKRGFRPFERGYLVLFERGYPAHRLEGTCDVVDRESSCPDRVVHEGTELGARPHQVIADSVYVEQVVFEVGKLRVLPHVCEASAKLPIQRRRFDLVETARGRSSVRTGECGAQERGCYPLRMLTKSGFEVWAKTTSGSPAESESSQTYPPPAIPARPAASTMNVMSKVYATSTMMRTPDAAKLSRANSICSRSPA